MDIATFRSTLPEFASTVTYTNAQVQFWLDTGAVMLRDAVWKTLKDQGLLYYTAHNLALAAQRLRNTAAGGIPGQVQGAVASKGVDKVSVGYDTNSTILKNGGLWNQTTYGIEFLQLARMVGAQGMIQTGGCVDGVNTGVFGSGYVN